ncbi:PepSY domain-containing protein [Coralloluteibacterium stylophorae]|uniref:PepSY domain-containing protein n=1 Tax=Coralloluteibacterium stylophorae TaxID=1776034 RepID=A0A8J8AX68_9GAMM|nr:PepSY domain-containing protein [Coralloluteibacterium stylophorae]MBS7458008.1 PepSY domain-containing protein [Coralloluteibacterium stylophorae]
MRKRILTSLVIGGALLGGSAVAQTTDSGSLTEAEVRQALTDAGYRDVNDLEFEDGMWEADATSGDGRNVDVRVDPASGNVYGDDATSRLSEEEVKAALSTEGYSNVHDIEFDDGVWTAEAERADGGNVEIRVDPTTGAVISVNKD